MVNLPAVQITLNEFVDARMKAVLMMTEFYSQNERIKSHLSGYSGGLYPSAIRPDSSLKSAIKQLDQKFWRLAFDVTEFSQLMDQKEQDLFETEIAENTPEFTLETVKETFLSLFQNADMLFQRGLVRVFRSLSNEYKTNSNEPFRMSKKFIMDNSASKCMHGFSFKYKQGLAVSDLDRVFKVLSGEKFVFGQLKSEIDRQWQSNNGVYECNMFKVKAYKKGSSHWTIKNTVLLEKINELISEYYGSNVLSA